MNKVYTDLRELQAAQNDWFRTFDLVYYANNRISRTSIVEQVKTRINDREALDYLDNENAVY